jgi:2-polyprenyl-3-methyl-5-hydroxy-6-metoxy-1,4-benzoquinol methylase
MFMPPPPTNVPCKICGCTDLRFFAHTATCPECRVLLCYPYPTSDAELFRAGRDRDGVQDPLEAKRNFLNWSLLSGARNHHNFTNMALFTLTDEDRQRALKVLDYGGGGGQFALVLKSLFPLAESYITDISDAKLLNQYRPLNAQIKFADFAADRTRFDVVFMNDVFEHLSDPLGVLRTLRGKLVSDGRVFIDTPRQFWIYPATKLLWRGLHTKLLRGTVDHDHQQIWSRAAFSHVVREAGFRIAKYVEVSEFTQPASYYLDHMKIRNPLVRVAGVAMYRLGRAVAKNKIVAVLKATH